MNRYSARDVAGILVVLLGLGIVVSGLLVNPWVPRIWQGAFIVDKADVMASYFVWSMGIGVATILLGRALPRAPEHLLGLSLLFFVIAAIVLGDRMLLVKFGLPLWEYDAELHFRHRPGIERTTHRGGDGNGVYRINSYGHHDGEFPVEKPEGEFRGVLIGDSVTMGYGLTYSKTFAAHLERLLEARDERHRSHQVINTGVHGYSSRQERKILEESLRFEPDFIAVGFCMNDVTEPLVVDERLGGIGLDYHGVTQTGNRIRGYLMNETGTGRLLQAIQARSKRLDAEKRRESFNVEQMAQYTLDDPEFAEPWESVLKELDQMYSIARSDGIPLVLLIFPFEFQLLREDLRHPQAILRRHAVERGVEIIDFTDLFRDAIYDDPELIEILIDRGSSLAEVQRFYGWKRREYFLDADHFTEKGHRLIADALMDYLESRNLIGATSPGA